MSVVGPVIQMVIGAICLGLPVITGIVSLVYALKTNEHHAAHRFTESMRTRALSNGWSLAGWIVCGIQVLAGVLCLVAVFFLGL